jgi:acyl-CoA reductase-like NAD-dependent aldehyde dehydrogenase
MFPSLTRSLVSKAAPLYPIVSRNPALGTVIQRFSFDTQSTMEKTLSTAQKGFEKFSSLSIRERGGLLKNLVRMHTHQPHHNPQIHSKIHSKMDE